MSSNEEQKKPKRKSRAKPPARTPDTRENQLVHMAMELAEKQMREGTATSQVITHFLKLGSPTEKLVREKLKNENELVKAKVEALKSQKKIEELYTEALDAMRKYSGTDDPLLEDDMDYDDEDL